jgi:glycosyltransferase involved in cell wall biosynthesis
MPFAGFVDRLADVYRGARVVVAPVTRGAGVNNKVLEPLAAGRPLVTTGVGTRGLPPSVLENIRYATDGASFAAELRALLSATWELEVARAARASVGSLSWDRAGALMENVLVDVAQRHTARHEHARQQEPPGGVAPRPVVPAAAVGRPRVSGDGSRPDAEAR